MKFLAPLVTAVLLAGCGQQPQTTAQAPSPPAQASETVAPPASVEAPAPSPTGYSPLPEGLVLDMPMHLRGDRIQTNPQGKMRRVVALELLGPAADEAIANINKAMLADGFQAKEQKTDAKGNPLLTFVKPSYGAVQAVVTSAPEETRSNPFATSVLIINSPFDGDPSKGTFRTN